MKRRSKKKRPVSYGQLENRQLLAADIGFATDTVSDTSTATETSLITVESSDDVVLGWNDLFGEILVEDTTNQNPGYASRSMAILNLAIYDAVALSSDNSENAFYEYDFTVGSNVDAEIAASQAAYTVLSELYPNQSDSIESFFQSTISIYHADCQVSASIEFGSQVGNAILEARADDGSDAVVDYTYTDEVGSFTADPLNPDVPVWGPGWGEVETFSVSSVEDLLPEGTPELTSQQYADSYNEVLELGSVNSETRTADQTEAGLFWAYDTEGLGTPMALFGDVLETIAIQEGNTFEENAALFAQASVSMADAGIVAWQTKFGEEFWRPATAILEGDDDGNDLTEGDEDWIALGAPDGNGDEIGFTPQFPTYISGHATFGGALFGAIQEFYGTDDISFDLESQELEILLEDPELQEAYGISLDDATRSFDTLSEAMAENGRSRVYLGIHFDFDDIDGQEVGQAVAAEVSSAFTVATVDESSDEFKHRNFANYFDRFSNFDRGDLNRNVKDNHGGDFNNRFQNNRRHSNAGFTSDRGQNRHTAQNQRSEDSRSSRTSQATINTRVTDNFFASISHFRRSR